MSKKAKSDYLIQSVSRALDLLEAFSAKEGALGVTELARKLKLHKNNVFRLLATLETRGYVEQDKETERYRLGAKVYEIAAVFLEHLDLRRQVRPYLESLAAKSGETTYLAVLERTSAGYAVDQEECEPGVVAVAAPVHDLARRVAGAVECGAPAFRWTLDRLKGELAPLVAGAASQIEAGLGLRPGAP